MERPTIKIMLLALAMIATWIAGMVIGHRPEKPTDRDDPIEG